MFLELNAPSATSALGTDEINSLLLDCIQRRRQFLFQVVVLRVVQKVHHLLHFVSGIWTFLQDLAMHTANQVQEEVFSPHVREAPDQVLGNPPQELSCA